MLAPVAEYSAWQMATSGEHTATSLAHATYFLRLSTNPHETVGQCLPADIDRLAEEHENILAAIRTSTRAGADALRLGLVLNLVPLWRVRGHLALAVDQLDALLRESDQDSYRQAVVRGVLAEFLNVLGEYDAAEESARAAEPLYAAVGHQAGVCTMLAQIGLAAAGRADFETAVAWYDRARPMLDSIPSDIMRAYWEAGVGRFELGRGNLEAAQEHLEEADRLFRVAPSWYHGRALAMLGVVAHRRGDLPRAATVLAEGLTSLRAYGATVDAIGCVEAMARLAMDQGHGRQAATLFAASTTLRDATAAAGSMPERVQSMADIDKIRSDLSRRDFETAWAAGVGMTLDGAAAVGMGTPTVGPSRRVASAGDALTPREHEIAALVALGLSNRAIADRLVIAPGTVKIHVERILGKLGRTSRVQIATWVQDQRVNGLSRSPVADAGAGAAGEVGEDMPTGRRPA